EKLSHHARDSCRPRVLPRQAPPASPRASPDRSPARLTSTSTPTTLPEAAALAAGVALLAWRLRALSGSGAAAATLIGASVLWGTGWSGAALPLVRLLQCEPIPHIALAVSGSDA